MNFSVRVNLLRLLQFHHFIKPWHHRLSTVAGGSKGSGSGRKANGCECGLALSQTESQSSRERITGSGGVSAWASLSPIMDDGQGSPRLMLHPEPVNLLYLTRLAGIEAATSATNRDKWPSMFMEYCSI